MKWESEVSNDQNYLIHYGVPGMKWGVITKEYIKKGYDTLKRRMAIKKRQHRSEGYQRGKRLVSNTRIVKTALANPTPKKDLIEKTVSKVLKNYGLEQYSKTASDLVKMAGFRGLELIFDSKTGQKAVKDGANALAKGTGWLLGKSIEASPHVKKAAKNVASTAGKAASATARSIGAASVRGYDWLKEGGAKTIQQNINKALNSINTSAPLVSKAVLQYSKRGSIYLSQLLKRGRTYHV